jgi:hypothetical protein
MGKGKLCGMSRHCLLLLLASAALSVQGEQNCPLPPSLQSASSVENIFSDQQEVYLGDAMAETIALHVNVVQNDDLGAHLSDLGRRLVQYLPPSKLNFRFFLIDLPEVNAFSIAGGRVYVSRKIVAFARNDDEIAGVLAHELGHIVTHQTAIEMTRAFREVLGVNDVGSRDDVFRKYHQYLENVARRRSRASDEGEKKQIVADQVSVFALARAGFDVKTFPEFWDRFAGLHRKTGSWISDLFGATTPAQHRLREMINNMGILPPGCADHRPTVNEAEFKTWQDLVVDSDIGARPEALAGLISKRRLTDRLRPEITNLRFSPDGRYILAQDDGGIHVVSRDPFRFLFYIPSPDAGEAKFSADSKLIMFSTTGMRVELWSVTEQKRKLVREITVRSPCLQTELSPDGNTLACLDTEHALKLINLSDASVLYEEKGFWHPSPHQLLNLLLTEIQERKEQESSASLHFVNMAFTPDGHYFLAAYGTPRLEAHQSYTVENRPVMGPNGEGDIVKAVRPSIQYYAEYSPGFLMFDLATRSKTSAPSSIRDEVGLSFSFLGPDRIVGINYKAPQKSRVLKFPSGETLAETVFWQGLNLRAATHGDFLIVGPLKDYPLGVMDLATRENKVVIKQSAADIYDGLILTEQVTGHLALHRKDKSAPLAVLVLPEGNLGEVRASAASPDLNFLAVSSRTRGAAWDVSHDFRAVQMRRFSAVGFDGAALYVDLPEFQSFARQTAEIHLDTGAHSFRELNKDDVAVQNGLYLIVTKPRKEGVNRSNADIDVRDIRSGSLLWSRYFPDEVPSISFDPEIGTGILRWQVSETAAHKELQGLPQLNQRAEKDDYLCEVLDAKSGARLSAFILKSNHGSLHFLDVKANQKWAVVEASGDQLIAYAIPSGEEQTQFFGSDPVLSTSGLLAFHNDKREVTLYDLATSEQRQQYVFAQPVVSKIFSADGKRLLIFTADQTVYFFDVTAGTATEKVAVND